MHQRYCSHAHPCEMQVNARDSNIWKMMLQSREDTEKHISWIVGQGDIDIYRDRWLNTIPTVFGHCQKMRDLFISNNLPDANKIRMTLRDDAYNEIDKNTIRLTS